MRHLLIVLSLWMASTLPAWAQVSIGIGMPGVSIGINVPVYPRLVRVPNYPVYYAPGLQANFFFYDGMYWVFESDNWYASSWYNGPWSLVGPEYVPVYVLRVPVRYYRSPPVYFRGWRADAPPRWGDHWGNDWQQRRDGWDRRDRSRPPPPAPLPGYQRKFPQTVIRRWSSSRSCRARTTATSRVTRWCESTSSRRAATRIAARTTTRTRGATSSPAAHWHPFPTFPHSGESP